MSSTSTERRPSSGGEQAYGVASPTPRVASGPRFSSQHLLEGRGWTPLRVLVDTLMATLAVVAAVLGAAEAGVENAGWLPLIALPPLVIAGLVVRGSYRSRIGEGPLDVVVPVTGAVSVSTMLIISFAVVVGAAAELAPLIARAWLFGLIFVGGGRIVLMSAQRRARARREIGKATLIVGAGRVGVQVARRLSAQREFGLVPAGFLDADPAPHVERTAVGVPLLGAPSDLASVARDVGAQHVILAFSSAPDDQMLELVRDCERLGLELSIVPRMFESITDRMALDHLGGLPLIGIRSVDPAGWQFACKYAADRFLALVLLLVSAPVMLGIAAAVKLTSPGPVLFRQRRVGRDGKVFDLLKFRSMRADRAAGDGFELAPGTAPGGVEGLDRRTPLGRLLRRTSLDELPQLINVLEGDMSLVGPRPERPEFVELFLGDVTRYGDRHRVKSGITGWAQVNGLRGQTSLSDRVEWDNFYIENWSLLLDCKILIMTLGAMFKHGD